MLTSLINEQDLHPEWIELILHAFQLGNPIDEIRNFLKETPHNRFKYLLYTMKFNIMFKSHPFFKHGCFFIYHVISVGNLYSLHYYFPQNLS